MGHHFKQVDVATDNVEAPIHPADVHNLFQREERKYTYHVCVMLVLVRLEVLHELEILT
jgi:hypothetical protein